MSLLLLYLALAHFNLLLLTLLLLTCFEGLLILKAVSLLIINPASDASRVVSPEIIFVEHGPYVWGVGDIELRLSTAAVRIPSPSYSSGVPKRVDGGLAGPD